MTDKIQINHVSKVFKVRDTDTKKGGHQRVYSPKEMSIFP